MTTTSVLGRDTRPAEREEVRDLVRAAFLPYAGTVRRYPAGGVDAGRLPGTWAWARAAADGAEALCLHTATFMTATHELAGRLGCHRTPEWDLDGGVHFGVHFGLPEGDLRIAAAAKELAA